MRSPAQIGASRRNGANSRGPVTPEGKKRSSHGHMQGITSRAPLSILLQTESDPGLRQSHAAWYAQLRPVGEVECGIVDQLVAADWRLSRCPSVEAGMWNHQIAKASAELRKSYGSIDHNMENGLAFQTLEDNHHTFANLARYETTLFREMDRILKRLAYIQSIRPQEDDCEIETSEPENKVVEFPAAPEPAPAPEPENVNPVNALQPNPKPAAEPVTTITINPNSDLYRFLSQCRS